MFHIPIVDTEDPSAILEFSHFSVDAPSNYWKKDDMIFRDNFKINVFSQGSFSVFTDGQNHSPIYGDVCLFIPRKVHYGHIPKPTHLDYYQLDFGVRAFDGIPGGPEVLHQLRETGRVRPSFLRISEQDREKVFILCEEMERSISRGEQTLAFAKAVEFVCHILRLYQTGGKTVSGTLSFHTQRILRHLESHYGESVTLAQLAAREQVSPSYLSRCFRKELGMGIHEYLNHFRILKAAELLQDHSVAETCYLCGFCDSSHFISVFKKHQGCTPMQYQKRFRSGKWLNKSLV